VEPAAHQPRPDRPGEHRARPPAGVAMDPARRQVILGARPGPTRPAVGGSRGRPVVPSGRMP
jgi:hypothetical protein